jgi:serine/threonine protein kinase
VVHRDIEPANLIVDGRGNLWVTDFGLAQFQTEASLTLGGELSVRPARCQSPFRYGQRKPAPHNLATLARPPFAP